MKKMAKPKTVKRAKASSRGGRVRVKRADTKLMSLADFVKISAIEGLHMGRDMHDMLRSLERKGASARERRAAVLRKYGAAS